MHAYFDYQCRGGHEFEEFVDRNAPEKVKCPVCGELSSRVLSAPRIDGSLGLDALSFPTMGDKWVRQRRQHQTIEERRKREHGA